jgi:hypothetical protein
VLMPGVSGRAVVSCARSRDWLFQFVLTQRGIGTANGVCCRVDRQVKNP